MRRNMTWEKVREGHHFPMRGGKSFSQLRTNFPSGGAEKRAGKLESKQLVAVGRAGMNHAGLQPAHGMGEGVAVRKWRAGHLQRNPCGKRQSPGDGEQNAARAQVEGGGKLEEFLALLVTATDEDRNRQGQSFPHSTVFRCSRAGHTFP
jgi:hypothetical protein